MKKVNLLFIGLGLLIVAVSCAREVSVNADDAERKYLDAYNTLYGPYEQSPSGLYYISPRGTGSPAPQDGQYAFIRYTIRTLSGSISETTNDSLSKQIGSYKDTLYFGPSITSIGVNSLMLGLEEVLKGMTAGESVSFIMPSWLSSYTEGGKRTYSTPVQMDVTLVEVVPDIARWQTDTLKNFGANRFPGLDSLAYDFYFTGPANAADTAGASDTLKISYVGYLLDGFVFDTNIADTAAKYKIYQSSRTYGPMTVIKSEMSFVEGFKKALNLMTDKSEVYTFFSSDYGYKENRQGQIQPYSPLCFYIKLEIGKVANE